MNSNILVDVNLKTNTPLSVRDKRITFGFIINEKCEDFDV